MVKISLCCICGQEESHAIRFLDSFAEAFDELCLVRAVGNQPHDRTVAICKEWCEKHGKGFKFQEYINAGGFVGHDAPVEDHRPETWKHVDDFGAARNVAWKLASHPWQMWADFDDVLTSGSAANIRTCAESGRHDIFCFNYSLATSQQHNFRERLFRTGFAEWKNPVHETCWHGDKPAMIAHEKDVVFSHEPQADKVRDPMRNWRIASYQLRHLNAYAHTLHQEAYYRWCEGKRPEDAEAATKWAEIAQHVDTPSELRMEILLNQADIAGDKDPDLAIELCWHAVRLAPHRRDPWGALCEYELRAKDPRRASIMADIMGMFKKPPESGFPSSDKYFSWQGLNLQCRAIRACANHYRDRGDMQKAEVVEARAINLEKAAHDRFGNKFSVLHATRGRPQQALITRHRLLASAVEPMAVEYIFAVDEDDKESMEVLRDYKHVIVREPCGCVKAWNAAAAASTGHVLVQMSDDWMPCVQWDGLMWLMLGDAALERLGRRSDAPYEGISIGRANAIQSVPLVLAINDGHRADSLLCMAILTRVRYEAQFEPYTEKELSLIPTFVATGKKISLGIGPYLFHPDYFGVFSDTEFSFRAYRDGVVVEAKHINFRHEHPMFAGKPFEEWDHTHQRQNAPERYAEGEAIFKRRNPDAKLETAVLQCL